MVRNRSLAIASTSVDVGAESLPELSRIGPAILANTPRPSAVSPDDSTLVVRVRQGDAAAFDLLVGRHYRAAYAIALGLLGRRADAEDVCQDAWARALERLDELREPSCFRGWLLQIVRNGARNHHAYLSVRASAPLEDEAAAGAVDPRQDLLRVSMRARLEAALTRLLPAQREVVVLHDLDGWSHREIAEQLGISEVMSRQHLFQARRRLRVLLEGRERKEHRAR